MLVGGAFLVPADFHFLLREPQRLCKLLHCSPVLAPDKPSDLEADSPGCASSSNGRTSLAR